MTKRQVEILHFIKQYMADHGYPPTVREIGDGLGLSSPATIQVHLNNLEQKNIIKKSNSKNRAIELLIENDLIERNDRTISVPFLGKVTAGTPIEAIETPNEWFDLPVSLIPKRKEIFTLLVSGDSMINAGIFDGDIIIVERSTTARDGQMVVAMNNENEVTLKTFYKENGYFRLQPENDTMEPIILKEVSILGLAIGLYRKL